MRSKEFEILARELRPKLVSTAYRVLQNRSAAEDVAQDTLLKLWSRRNDLEEFTSIEAYAYTTAYHLALNTQRNASHGIQTTDYPEYLSDHENPETRMMKSENDFVLDAILSQLPESQQTLIRMRHIEGYDNSTIATLLGTSEGAVRTALSRVRRKIALAFGTNPTI